MDFVLTRIRQIGCRGWLLLCLLAALVVAGLLFHDHENVRFLTQALKLQLADAGADARQAAKENDFRFVGVDDGLFPFVPGAPRHPEKAWSLSTLKIFSDTSSCIDRSFANDVYTQAATAYAERYNRALLNLESNP